MDTIDRAIEELIDRYLDGCDFTDLKLEIMAAVIEEVQSESSSIEDLENRIKDLEEKFERMANAIKP